ncbi:MAG TPA: RDD family protein [Terracidiphilus sp.]
MNPIDQSSDQLSIETPELVAIQMPIAGIGSRFIALLVDYLIWVPAILLVGKIFSYILPSLTAFNRLSEQWAVAIYIFLIFLFNWGYFTLFEAFWNGRTPGKRVARIRVIQRSGRAIGLFESMARNFIRYIDMIPIVIPYAVGTIAIFVTRDHQRLGDLAAGTLVVRDRIEEAPASTESTRTFTANLFAPAVPTPEPHAGFSLPDHDIAKLTSADLQVLEGFFARRLDMPMATREALALRIAAAIQAKSGLEPPPGASTETFLEITARQLRDIARLHS